jgi:hypothetical protein
MNVNGPGDRWPTRTAALGLVALAALLILGVCQSNFVDPDVWHEMALIRQARHDGALPTHDSLAYTRTLNPSIHHEWGTGVMLLVAATSLGGSGLLLLKFGLTAGIAVACVSAARRSGAAAASFCSVAPVAIFLSWYGFSTVRAQMFTLLFTALLMVMLALDRQGKRGWILIWLIAHLIWLNLHAGFVVGLILLGCHTIEQAAHRRPITHLIAGLAAGSVLVLANPYGWTYVQFLSHSLLLSRPAIEEWLPTWQAPVPVVMVFVISLVLILYSIAKLGPRQLPGLLPLLAATWAGLSHQRHLSIYAVVWVCLVPAWLDRTAIGLALDELWTRRPNAVRVVCAAVVAVCFGATLLHEPWRVSIPSQPGDHPDLTYPVGAVAWLDEVHFQGNLEVPFLVGAFVAWKLNPEVRVSIDSRYEVAYPPEALQQNLDTYAARSGWEARLDEQARTDAVLVPAGGPLAEVMPSLAGWTRRYRDDAFEVYLRGGSTLPSTDRRGQVAVGTFP